VVNFLSASQGPAGGVPASAGNGERDGSPARKFLWRTGFLFSCRPRQGSEAGGPALRVGSRAAVYGSASLLTDDFCGRPDCCFIERASG